MLRRNALPLVFAPTLPAQSTPPSLEVFSQLTSNNPKVFNPALSELERKWKNSYAVMLLEMLTLLAADNPARDRLLRFLELRTGQTFGLKLHDWHRWLWSLPYDPHPHYAMFKGILYANFDPRMQTFFPLDRQTQSRVRLDQVEWGGVRVNGIPPLVNPKHIPAAEASYLKDNHTVFGLSLGNQSRAYPKRILAWHEMARDTVDGQNICLVYCTLCGTVIPYLAQSKAGTHTFGTSGLLYESSKLMFDEETNSLWSTLQGQPVIGPLANSGLQLDFVNVVTTTWGEWRALHPDTTALSLDTGHRRDYGEGAAYRAYFASDDLMFQVSRKDTRLRRKDEILAIRLPQRQPLAIAMAYLLKHPQFSTSHEGATIEVQTTRGGATTVKVDGKPFPAHRAFWFAWYTQFPATALIR
jgi:hypothetical protein